MDITVNGEPRVIDGATSVVALLEQEDVESPDMVAVQLNGSILEREAFPQTVLKRGDEVEFLYFMGGG
jgi:sulfur carrier protein